MTGADQLEAVARALCLIDGVDPDSTIDDPGFPEWCSYRERARRELAKAGAGGSGVRRRGAYCT
jgi:hypothetical protein